MNRFGEMSSGHSTWPVTLCMYNLPLWLCMKRKFIMMPVLIPGTKQPGNDIDVYLRPLVEELLLLWWDVHLVKSIIIWTIEQSKLMDQYFVHQGPSRVEFGVLS